MNRNGFEMEVDEDEDEGDDDDEGEVEGEVEDMYVDDDNGEVVTASEEESVADEAAWVEVVLASPLLASNILSTMKLFTEFKGSCLSACARDKDARRSVKARVLSISSYRKRRTGVGTGHDE